MVNSSLTFVGRTHLLRTLKTAIKQQRSTCLVGGPGMGRTLTLAQLQYLAEQAWLLPQRQMVPLCVRVDLTKLQEAPPHQLASQVFLAICEAVLSPYVQRHNAPPSAPTVHFQPSNEPFALMWEALAALWQSIRNTVGWCRYVLLLDNAEALSDLQHACMLLDWVDAAEAFKPLACVLAIDPITAYRLAKPHPWALLPHHSLHVLTQQEVQHWATVAKLPHDRVAALAAACGRHPYVLSLLCQSSGASMVAVEAALSAVQPQVQAWLQKVLESLHPKGSRDSLHLVHRVLQQVLAAKTEHEHVPIKLIQQQVLPLASKSAIDCLLAMGVVECKTRAEQTLLHANNDLWNQYYRENYHEHA